MKHRVCKNLLYFTLTMNVYITFSERYKHLLFSRVLKLWNVFPPTFYVYDLPPYAQTLSICCGFVGQQVLQQIHNKNLCYRRGTARRAVSVNILSTVERSCTTNPQQIAVLVLEGYSWPTCSKQPRLVDCPIGVVNKLHRRRRRRVLLTTRSTCRGEIF